MLYHVTPSENLPSILGSGLKPAIGPRSAELGEPQPFVYLFRSLQDVETALMNWLGEALEDAGELAILEIEPSATTASRLQTSSEDYEVRCDTVIPANCITRMLDEHLEEMKAPAIKTMRQGT